MDASVEFLLDNVKQLVLYHVSLMADARYELERLDAELSTFKAMLKTASQKYKKDEIYKAWEKEIRELVYDIEDTIDTCVTHMAAQKGRRTFSFKKLFVSAPFTMAKAVNEIRTKKVRPLLDKPDFSKNFTIADAADTTVARARETRQKRTNNIVGLEKEAKEFIDFINSKSNTLQVGSIVGMPGLGKTTLTWKIFEDSTKTTFEFPHRIWVNVSEILNMENILLTILKHFTNSLPPKSSEEELRKMVVEYLKEAKSLIVFDDIWELDAWLSIKEILPLHNGKCKVLITTRFTDVAEVANKPHYLRFLTAKESWEVLQYKVYGELDVVPEGLIGIGQAIATDCNGLPLSIVVIGGILLEKKLRAGNNTASFKNEWKEISMSVKRYLVSGDNNKLLRSIISLSYENIPHELRNCFLYLGIFPEDANIHIKELIRLWIAEGFILETEGMSLEQVGLENVKELINRNLVMVKKAKVDGEPKICHIHDSVREMCRAEAKYDNLNLFQEITNGKKGFEPENNIEKCRRLSIHSYFLDFLKENNKLPKARSILCYQAPMTLKSTDMPCVTGAFGLLRVYNAKNIKFPRVPEKLLELLHLRYLTLAIESCTSLSDAISEIWNLQTLIVDVPSPTLDIKADIWKMRHLRHLKTKASITLRKDGKGKGCENLQTLSRLSPESCTEEVFSKAKNLLTLGIQGELNKFTNPECLMKLTYLQKLKLVNEVSNSYASQNPLKRLPDPQSFPPNLRILVLTGTYMQWTNMAVLAMLGFLEVLKLKESAFVGTYWEAHSTFRHLECLHIERATDLVTWTSTDISFPKLKFLFLNHCDKLIQVPPVVCEHLELLCLEHVTKDAISSAKAILEYKQQQGVVFKLEIAPGNMSD